ncbi:MAG: F0F1 ATP synthase subunit A [bacterium]
MEQTLATTTKLVTHEEVKHESTLYAEPVFHIGTFAVTNSLITSWVAVFVIVVLSTVLRLRMKKIPSKIQHFFEYVVEGGLSLADQITGNRRVSERVFPVAISIFFFILINNWLGILPLGGFGVIERGADGASFIPFIRSGTADINTTLMLALVSVIASNIFGIIVIGLWKAINKYINLKALSEIVTKVRKEPTVVIMAPVMFFVGLIEIVGEIAKIASLSFRLFGNVFAGEVLLASMGALFAYGLPIPFLFLEVLVGFIQALIFSMLTLVYFTIAAEDHDAHDEGGHEHAEVEAHA